MARPKGINQKQIAFKIDLDLLDYVNEMSQGNRNRFLNNLIKEAKKKFEHHQQYMEMLDKQNYV